jgi:uncharacterized cupin superfamily protein
MSITSDERSIKLASRHDDALPWAPHSWTDPRFGQQLKGESVTIRPLSSSGRHTAGLWRSGVGIAGCEPDGSCDVEFSAPDADIALIVLEGRGTVTVASAGESYDLRPGSILSQPRDLETSWHLDGGQFRALWVRWENDQTDAAAFAISHVDEEPAGWQLYEWNDPTDGTYWNCGENNVLRSTGSDATLMCGVWRSGTRPDGDADADRSDAVQDLSACRGPLCAGHITSASRGNGDETMIILEGRAILVNEDTGEELDVEAGDILAQYSGMNFRWTSRTPYVKKFWIMTQH